MGPQHTKYEKIYKYMSTYSTDPKPTWTVEIKCNQISEKRVGGVSPWGKSASGWSQSAGQAS